jgi:hypothetical protein
MNGELECMWKETVLPNEDIIESFAGWDGRIYSTLQELERKRVFTLCGFSIDFFMQTVQ